MRNSTKRRLLVLLLATAVLALSHPAAADEPSAYERYALSVLCARTGCVRNPNAEVPHVVEHLNAIWIPILRVTRIPADEPISLYLTGAKEPNAWALKHYWGITAGLWNLRMTRDELAFVAAHELAHIELGHYQRKQEEIAKIYVLAIIGLIISQGNYNPLNDRNFVTVANLVLAAYSREFESEADLRAIQTMRAAGFDEQASITALQRFDPFGVSGTGDLFDSHPSVQQRIARLRRELPIYVPPSPQNSPQPDPAPSPLPAPSPIPTLSPTPASASTPSSPPEPVVSPRSVPLPQPTPTRRVAQPPKVRVVRALVDGEEMGDVLVGDRVVLRIRTTFEGRHPFERADTVAETLNRLITSGLTPEEIRPRKLFGKWVIVARNELVLTIDSELARRNGTSSAKLALAWTKAIQAALAQLR